MPSPAAGCLRHFAAGRGDRLLVLRRVGHNRRGSMKALQALVCSVVCFIGLAAATPRRAEAAYWHTTASGCQWDGSGFNPSPVPTASLAGAQFNGTNSGDITL